MDFENNSEISQFLDRFEKENSEVERAFSAGKASALAPKNKTADKDESFKKLENKVNELERKFENTLREKEVLSAELARSRENEIKERSRDEFFHNISHTIANLKDSVDRLNAARYNSPSEVYGRGYYYGAPIHNQEAENQNRVIVSQQQKILTQEEEISRAQAALQRQEIERAEMERSVAGLREKTSRLKAVNMALDKEFKRVQDEKIEALRKSAEQAKEILSLREQLNRAEEKFKSFDFDGRIISIRNHYEQKVAKLETQLQEMSAVCMKQVEEIEALKTENMSLKALQEDRRQLQKQYEEKAAEAYSLQKEIDRLNHYAENDLKLQTESKLEQTTRKAKEEVLKIQAEYKNKDEARTKENAVLIKSIADAADGKIAGLQTRLAGIEAEKSALEQRLETSSLDGKKLSEENARFSAAFKALSEKMKSNDAVIEQLKKKIDVLHSENVSLKRNTVQEIPVSAPRTPVQAVVPAKAPAKPVYVATSQPQQPVAPRRREDVVKARAEAKGRSGEERDFLADTQSFVGRLKWSLLKDD